METLHPPAMGIELFESVYSQADLSSPWPLSWVKMAIALAPINERYQTIAACALSKLPTDRLRWLQNTYSVSSQVIEKMEGSEWPARLTLPDFTPEPELSDIERLARRRLTASLAKSDLLIGMATHGLISWEEAAGAASGQIPASLAPMLEEMPAAARAAAIIKWSADAEISRMHPVILTAAYALGVSDEVVDQIFGL